MKIGIGKYSKSIFLGTLLKKIGWRQVWTWLFFFFFAKYLTRFDNFSKWCSSIGLFCYGKSSNTIAKKSWQKKEKKPCSTSLQPISPIFQVCENPRFGLLYIPIMTQIWFFFNIQTLLKRHNELYVYISAIFCDFSNDTI